MKSYAEKDLKESDTSVIMQLWIFGYSFHFCFFYAPLPIKYASVFPALLFLKCYLSILRIFWQEKCIFHRKFYNNQDKFYFFFFPKKCGSSTALQTDTVDEAMSLSCLKVKGRVYNSLHLLLSAFPKGILINLYSWKYHFLGQCCMLLLPEGSSSFRGK